MNCQSSKGDLLLALRDVSSLQKYSMSVSFESFALSVEEVIGLRFLVQEQLQGLVRVMWKCMQIQSSFQCAWFICLSFWSEFLDALWVMELCEGSDRVVDVGSTLCSHWVSLKCEATASSLGWHRLQSLPQSWKDSFCSTSRRLRRDHLRCRD